MNTELTLTTKQAIVTGGAATLVNLIKPLQQEIYLCSTFIAKRRTTGLDPIISDANLSLRREPNCRFDDRAVAVLDAKGRTMGYIPEKDSPILANLMDAGKLLTAKVEGMELVAPNWHVRIGIYLVDF